MNNAISETNTDASIDEQMTSKTTTGETEEQIHDEWTNYQFSGDAKLRVEDLNVWYGDDHAISRMSRSTFRSKV